MLTVLLICTVVIETLFIIVIKTKARKPNFDGSILVKETEERKLFTLELDADPDTLDNKRTVLFRVRKVI